MDDKSFKFKYVFVKNQEEVDVIAAFLLKNEHVWWREEQWDDESNQNCIYITKEGSKEFFFYEHEGEDDCENMTYQEFVDKYIKPNPNNMTDSNIVEFHKNSKLSANEKLLRKAGIIDSCNMLTGDGHSLLTGLCYEEHEAALVALATEYLAEKKKCKKK